MIMFSTDVSTFGIIFWLGSLKRSTFLPAHVTLATIPGKVFIYTLILAFSSRVIHDILEFYQIHDQRCLVIHGKI